jgi:hypothetical protein
VLEPRAAYAYARKRTVVDGGRGVESGTSANFRSRAKGGPLARRIDRPEADVPRPRGPRQLPITKASATMPHEWRGSGNSYASQDAAVA